MMNKVNQPKPDTPVRRLRIASAAITVLLVIAGAGSAWYVYVHEQGTLSRLDQTHTSLTKQAASLTAQLNAAKAAGNITPADWRTYCDPYANLCFQYPANWSITSSHSTGVGVSDLGMSFANLGNPGKSLGVSYLDDYIKDDFPASFIVHSVTPLPQAGKDIYAYGGYYVSAGGHTPMYFVANSGTGPNDLSPNNKSGQGVLAAAVPLFQYPYRNSTALGQFTVTGKTYATTEEADAWFNSVDGKTALKVASSFVSGSSYTGKYLTIPEFGIRMKLTYNTQDAYYQISNSPVTHQPAFVRLTVHALDAYAGCSLSQDGIAAIGSFTKGESDPVVGDYGKAYPLAPLIDGKYYYVARGQYDCTLGNASALLSDATHDFVNAYSTIESTKKQ